MAKVTSSLTLETKIKKRLSKFIADVSEKLDKELYGMNNVKEQLLVFLN